MGDTKNQSCQDYFVGWINLKNFVDYLTLNLTPDSYEMNFGLDPLNKNK